MPGLTAHITVCHSPHKDIPHTTQTFWWMTGWYLMCVDTFYLNRYIRNSLYLVYWIVGPKNCWAEAPEKNARMTLTIKLDGNWSSFQLANSAPPLSVTDSAIAPSARISHICIFMCTRLSCFHHCGWPSMMALGFALQQHHHATPHWPTQLHHDMINLDRHMWIYE
jgi:hypothetical protein